MITKKNKWLLWLALLPVLVLVLAFTFKDSFALFSSQHSIDNKLNTHYKTSIGEDFQPPDGTWNANTDVTKKVWVENTGKTDVLLRVHYAEFWEDADGRTLSNTLSKDDQAGDVVTKSWTSSWTNDWVRHDGWYYYKKVLKAGEQTPEFLSKINLNTALIHAVDGEKSAYYAPSSSYHLNFYNETVQAEPGTAVTKLWGLDPQIVGDDVDWHFTP